LLRQLLRFRDLLEGHLGTDRVAVLRGRFALFFLSCGKPCSREIEP
jgi:hypothetical protein